MKTDILTVPIGELEKVATAVERAIEARKAEVEAHETITRFTRSFPDFGRTTETARAEDANGTRNGNAPLKKRTMTRVQRNKISRGMKRAWAMKQIDAVTN